MTQRHGKAILLKKRQGYCGLLGKLDSSSDNIFPLASIVMPH